MTRLPPHLNTKVVELGRELFRELGKAQPSSFNSNYWNGRLMQWSMTQPELKTNLFRLVDVLPVLTNKSSIASHVREYLGDSASKVHPAFGWAVGLSKNSMAAGLTSFFVKQGVHQMASQFIAGSGPRDALSELERMRRDGYAFTVDLLGEFCVCEPEAREYLHRYLECLDVLAERNGAWRRAGPLVDGHLGESSPISVSVKLTALYSQTGALNFDRSVDVLSERLAEIVRKAKAVDGSIFVDAEDSGNNPIIYEAFKRVFSSTEFLGFPRPGAVVQAYAKGSEQIIRDLIHFGRSRGPIAIRLVKGAYWDHERVASAQQHWNFPLWEQKSSTDAHYEQLTRLLLENRDVVYPAFGSHNIRSLAHACCFAEERGIPVTDFELQVLYGMAEPIAKIFRDRGYLVRMYVPLGELLPGMGYLVRRLLENTSNESFLRHTFFDSKEVETLLQEPEMVG